MVEFTFLWAETLLGAVPVEQDPQLCEVVRTVILAVVGVAAVVVVLVGGGVTDVAGAVDAVWHIKHCVLASTNVCEAGVGAPKTQDPHAGIAKTLPEKNMGNASADAKTTALMDFIMSPWR